MTRAELAEIVAQHVWEHHGIEAPIDRKYLGRLERGEVRWPNARYRQALRDILGVPSDEALGFYSANAERTAKELEPVNRRSFVRVAAFGGVAMASQSRAMPPVDPLPAAANGDLDEMTAAVERLEQRDASFGGGASLHEAIELYERVTLSRNEGASSMRADRALARLQGDIGAWAGWLAYDAGDLSSARSFLADTIVHARTADLPDIEVRAMSYLALLLNRTGRYRDALHCAEAGQRIASPRAPKTVRALLHMRAAAAHAAMSDRRASRLSIEAAFRTFEGPSSGPEPLWARFVTRGELEGLRAHALTMQGDHREAADAFQSIVDQLDSRYRRNTAYYRSRLAASLLAEGDVSQACTRALAVVPDACRLQSKRVDAILREIRAGVEPHRTKVPEAQELIHACKEALIA